MSVRYDLFISENDVKAKVVSVRGIDFRVRPLVEYDTLPQLKWDFLLARARGSDVNPIYALGYFMRVADYCESCMFIIPAVITDQSMHVIGLTTFITALTGKREVLDFARRHMWIIPIMGTMLLDQYVSMCRWLRRENIHCLYGINAMHPSVTVEGLSLKFINCVSHPRKCMSIIRRQYVRLVRLDKDALIHITNVPGFIMRRIVNVTKYTRVVSMDTIDYVKHGDVEAWLSNQLK